MQQEENRKNQEIISIEEYLYKRKKFCFSACRTLYVRN